MLGRCANISATTVSQQLGFYAAGFLEGYVTAASICDFSYDFSVNAFAGNETYRDVVLSFLTKNYEWVQSNTQSNSSRYWQQVTTVLAILPQQLWASLIIS